VNKDSFRGKKCLAVERCSTGIQVQSSLPQQRELLIEYAARAGLEIVEHFPLPAESASVDLEREYLDRLIQRKRDANDYEVLLFQSIDRLTRQGGEDIFVLRSRFRKVGVRFAFAAYEIADDEYGDFQYLVEASKAKGAAEALGFLACRGRRSKIAAGEIPYSCRIPYGIDRLFVDKRDGRPLHIIRNLSDRRQEMLTPDGQHINYLAPNVKKGAINHYRKQRHERIELIKGSPETVAVVREIFSKYFVDGWGQSRIAKTLNERGIPGPTGCGWNISTIASVLKNSIYLTVGVGMRLTRARHKMMKDGTPQPPIRRPASQDDPPTKWIPVATRPEEDWDRITYKGLDGFLDETLHDVVHRWQQERLKAAAERRKLPINRNRHRLSPYLLSGILSASPGDRLMSGVSTGRADKAYRYYMVPDVKRKPSGDHEFKGSVPAEIIEERILQLVEETCACPDAISDMVREYVYQRVRNLGAERVALSELTKQRRDAEEEVIWLASFTGRCGDVIEPKKLSLEARLKSLDAQIECATKSLERDALDPEAVAASVTQQLTELTTNLREQSIPTVKRLLKALISKLIIDMKSNHLEVELRVPKWALTKNADLLHHVRVDTSIGSSIGDDTNIETGLVLARYSCSANGRDRTDRCWDCSRASLRREIDFSADEGERAKAA
jgi:Recombinase/Resolvase, N terminal domain